MKENSPFFALINLIIQYTNAPHTSQTTHQHKLKLSPASPSLRYAAGTSDVLNAPTISKANCIRISDTMKAALSRGCLPPLCSTCLTWSLRQSLAARPLVHEQSQSMGRRAFTTAAPLLMSTKTKDKKAQGPDTSEALQYYRSHGTSLSSLTKAIKSRVLSNPPKEGDVIAALIACKEHAAHKRLSAHSTKASPTAAILSLDDTAQSFALKQGKAEPTTLSPSPEDAELVKLAFTILTHPSIFISEDVLTVYVDLAVYLRQLSNLPAAFALYAKKPYFRPGSSTPSKTYPALPKYAVPDEVASKALDAAVSAKNMELALDIINTAYGAPAYRWNKIIRKAAPAGVATLLSPAAVYILAQQAAKYQDVVDQDLAAKYAFTGLLAYLGFTASIGLVALTTANDQMERVTWLVGTPLSKRWLYEDERAAYDRLAQGWGFKDPNMRYVLRAHEISNLLPCMGYC